MDVQTIAKLQAAARERLKTDPHASYVLTLLLQDSEGIAWINGRYRGGALVAAARRLQVDGLVGTVFEAMRGRFACTVAR
jgi:hypothetical protein